MADNKCASNHPWGANTRTEVPQGEHRMGDVEPATVEYAVDRQAPGIRGGLYVGHVDEATREKVVSHLPKRTDAMPAWASRAVPLVMLSNGSLFLDCKGQQIDGEVVVPDSASSPTVEYAVRTRQHYAAFEPVGDLETEIAAQMMALFALFRERQRKYGPGNIAAFGDYGVLVRCHDKLARLKRHYTEGTGDMPDESVDDAWSDLAVYAVIALVCREGGWPGLGVKP